jgi:trans-aconitate methyltransferase
MNDVTTHAHGHGHDDHDWQSYEYVDDWIARDLARAETRRPLLQQMLETLNITPDTAIRVLDVGAGNGHVTEEVLKRFPKASVTLQDYSGPMLDRARTGLAKFPNTLAYSQSDLTDPNWTTTLAGPFDVAVSAIALHNLGDKEQIAAVYRAIRSVLAPKGAFANMDYCQRTGGIDWHLQALRDAGFSTANCSWLDERAAIITARVA